jgi:hypothetical protein
VRSPLYALTFVVASLAACGLAAAPAFAQSTCPPDTTYVSQWVENASDTDITHIQCQQLSAAAIKKLAAKMYPAHFTGTKPPTLPSDFLPRQPYVEVTPRHWYWAHAPSTGYLTPSAMRDLVRGGAGGAGPGVP